MKQPRGRSCLAAFSLSWLPYGIQSLWFLLGYMRPSWPHGRFVLPWSAFRVILSCSVEDDIQRGACKASGREKNCRHIRRHRDGSVCGVLNPCLLGEVEATVAISDREMLGSLIKAVYLIDEYSRGAWNDEVLNGKCVQLILGKFGAEFEETANGT